MKMNKGKGKAKKPIVPVTDAQVAQFQLQINGGRFGRGEKLHDHGFELDISALKRYPCISSTISEPLAPFSIDRIDL